MVTIRQPHIPIKKIMAIKTAFIHTLALSCLLLISGCIVLQPRTYMSSNRAATYTKEPKRVFLITDAGSEFGEKFYSAFKDNLGAAITECGATFAASRITELELDNNTHLNKMKEFGADTLLSVRRNGGTKMSTGAFMDMKYDIKLIDAQSDKVVWRANANFFPGNTTKENDGKSMATQIIEKMKADKIFTTCPAATEKK
jgi:hypothetical protein